MTRTSQLTGKENTMELQIDKKDLFDYNNGLHVQHAFPYLEAHEREFIKSGITKAEWDKAFN